MYFYRTNCLVSAESKIDSMLSQAEEVIQRGPVGKCNYSKNIEFWIRIIGPIIYEIKFNSLFNHQSNRTIKLLETLT